MSLGSTVEHTEKEFLSELERVGDSQESQQNIVKYGVQNVITQQWVADKNGVILFDDDSAADAEDLRNLIIKKENSPPINWQVRIFVPQKESKDASK